jgi:protein-S-isoprenylcysteine O-methyltransferase Ste14
MLKVASLAGFVAGAIALAWLLLQGALVAEGVWLQTLQVLALLLMVWARATFGRRSFHAAANPTEGGFVTSGPYRILRHPIYASVLYVLWMGVLSHFAPTNVFLGLIVSAGLAVRMYAEEHLLLSRYPEYAAYARRTKRVVPYIL